MKAKDLPLFVAHNLHAASCGEPPHFSNKPAARYMAYFESESGDQWVFVYDRSTRKATIYGGDMNWDHPVTISSLAEIPYHFTNAERLWTEACWRAVRPADPL